MLTRVQRTHTHLTGWRVSPVVVSDSIVHTSRASDPRAKLTPAVRSVGPEGENRTVHADKRGQHYAQNERVKTENLCRRPNTITLTFLLGVSVVTAARPLGPSHA